MEVNSKMNSIFVLILLFITPQGELIVAQDDEMFPTAVSCQAAAVKHLSEAEKQVLWITTSCAEVPKDPRGKPVSFPLSSTSP